MKEKALLQSTVQDQRNSSDEREDSTHSQVISVILCIGLTLGSFVYIMQSEM